MSIEHSFFYNGDTTYGEEELGAVFDATFSQAIPGMARINYLVVYFG